MSTLVLFFYLAISTAVAEDASAKRIDVVISLNTAYSNYSNGGDPVKELAVVGQNRGSGRRMLHDTAAPTQASSLRGVQFG
jgi:hypothetical protein